MTQTPLPVMTALRAALKPDQVLTGRDIPARNRQDASRAPETEPLALLLPRSTADVATALAICNAHHQAVIPQGGMTGLVKAAHPDQAEIAISMERMVGIEEIDSQAGTLTAWAGTPLMTIQQAAEQAGFLCGIDLGARGSCSIGGNIATNAGGNQVLRYGMARRNVLGLEAVLADGQIVTSMNKMLKNNAGYDWTQLFIGSEGTLGLITRAVLAMHPRPKGVETALVAVRSTQAAIDLLRDINSRLAGGLQVFEAMWSDFLAVATGPIGLQKPFAQDPVLAVLIESPTNGTAADKEAFETVLGNLAEEGLIEDAIIAQSDKDRARLWAYRESPYEYGRFLPHLIGFDVSVPIGAFEPTIARIKQDMAHRWPEALVVTFGHLADSNLHMIMAVEGLDADTKHAIEEMVYHHVAAASGSVSAEHGIGRSKRDYLALSRTPSEIRLMKTIKHALDPNGILSPGRIF
jgi:FAD/FMN-containing dehydrogenase